MSTALLALSVIFGRQPVLQAQSAVTSISAGYVTTATPTSYLALPASPGTFSGCSSTLYTYNFSSGTSNQYKLNGFNAGGNTYLVAPGSLGTVKLRRINNTNATGNRNILYMETTASTAPACPVTPTLNLAPPYLDVMETALGAGILNQGTDNIFTNAGNGDGNNNNIERVDVLFPSGLNTSSPSEAGFAIFDRGNNYQHDPFKIVAITSLDANGDPASFGPVRSCSGGNGSSGNGNWGHPSVANGNKSFAAYVMRKDPSDSRLRVSSNVNQEIGGVFYSFADLGISAGQPLYGYALLGPDGTASPSSAQLLNLSNTSVYPTGTTEAAGGGLDLVAVNTVFETGSYVVLPIRIGSFTGRVQNDRALLQWELEDAMAGDQVTLERSTDAVTFSTLYSTNAVDALQNTYTDAALTGGDNYYYRLKVTSTSGKVQYSQTIALHSTGRSSGWKLWPTLADRSEPFRLQGLRDGAYTMSFYSLTGNAWKVDVRVVNGQGWASQPAKGLPSGIYWIGLRSGDRVITGGMKILIR